MLDFGGIAEGYAIDLILKIFKSYDIKNVLINFGGNISTLSTTKDWFVEIGDLSQRKKILLNNKSISTSTKKSKKIKIGKKDVSHIYNFKEKIFAEYEDITLSVVSKDPIFCDALSTSLIAMPSNKRDIVIKNNKIEIFISGN
jgi:thiamine biosynthesis lipoprotein